MIGREDLPETDGEAPDARYLAGAAYGVLDAALTCAIVHKMVDLWLQQHVGQALWGHTPGHVALAGSVVGLVLIPVHIRLQRHAPVPWLVSPRAAAHAWGLALLAVVLALWYAWHCQTGWETLG